MRYTLHNIIGRPGATNIRKEIFSRKRENLLELKNPSLPQYVLNARNKRTRNSYGS